MTQDSFSLREKRVLWLLAAVYLIAIAASVWLHRLPVRDMAHRYIPMAEAFAAGDWEYAFHPRVQPLQPICGGVIAFLTGADGFLALKIASALWSIAGGVLICVLFRELYRKERWVAVTGTVLYAFFPYMYHMAYSGLRESAKGCILILLALGLVRIRRDCRSLNGFILTGIGAALASLVRADMLAVGFFCLFAAGVFEAEKERFPFRTAAASLFGFGAMFLNILINVKYYRAAMPDVRFAEIFLKLTGRQAGIGDALFLGAAGWLLLLAAAWGWARLYRRIRRPGWIWGGVLTVAVGVAAYAALVFAPRAEPGFVGDYLEVLLKSFYYFVAPIALIHVGAEIRRKQFPPEEHAVLLVVAANLLLCAMQIQIFHRELYLSPRYIFPATPLLFGAFILGVRDIYRWLSLFLPRQLANCILLAAWCGLAVMYCYHAPQPLFREYHHPRRLAEQRFINRMKEIILDDYRWRGGEPEIRRNLWYYNSRRRPKIWFSDSSKITIAACLAGGSIATELREADYAVAEEAPGAVKKAIGRVNDGRHDYVIWRMR